MTSLQKVLKLTDIQRERSRRNLSYFVKHAWPLIEPTEYMHNWHIDAICDHLQAVSNGQIRRLIVNIPPRCMKSTLIATMWPVWTWIDQPDFRWLFASYALNLSIRDAVRARRIVESPWYQQNWGDHVQFREDQNAKSYYETTAGGARLSISVGSAATGHGGNVVCVDDAHNAQEADSTAIRESTLSWWSETMSSRLNNPKTGAFVIIMQRLHEKDLTGFLLEQGGYEHLCLPLEYEPSRKIFTNLHWVDTKGVKHEQWTDPRTEAGEILWKERFNDESVKALKRTLGSYGYAAQYQQLPSPSGGGIFKKTWMHHFRVEHAEQGDEYIYYRDKGEVRVLDRQCRRFITVDLASSLKEISDYTVVAVWVQTPENDLLLLHILRERMEAHEQQRNIQRLYHTYHCEFIDVESVGYQLTLVQQLVRAGLPVRPYTPVRDKVSRARTASIRYEAGTIYHLSPAEWLHDFEQELLGFPVAEHDDQVDVTSRAAEIVVGDVQPNIRDFTMTDAEVQDLMKPPEKREIFHTDEYEIGKDLPEVQEYLDRDDDWRLF